MTLEQEKDNHAITIFILRYEAKGTLAEKSAYIERFHRLVKEEGVNIPLVAKSRVDELLGMIDESIATTDRCLKVLNTVEFRTEAEADEIIPILNDEPKFV